MKYSKVAFALAGLVLAGGAEAGHRGHGGLEACLEAVSAVKPGNFVKVEYLSLTDEGKAAYEVEVRDRAGREWEFECSARGAQLLEMEQETEAGDAAFTSKAKVDLETAKATATALYPGKVEEIEYEIEADGTPVYEFDIADDGGPEYKVEVDAVSGEIVEVQIEAWEIGEEDVVR
ncbi:MAG: PepSY domain-containing protein [Gammaproteobacteria bacterium]